MRFIYMNNYRGFNEAVVPLSQMNFLVGENSTGKSSFLKLIRIISNPNFWIVPVFPTENEEELGGFKDIVSAWASDKSYFDIGVINLYKAEQSDKQKFEVSYSFLRFKNKDGIPKLSVYSRLKENLITTLVFENTRTKFRTKSVRKSFSSAEEGIACFRSTVKSELGLATGYTLLPKDIPPNPPLPMAMNIIQSMQSGKGPTVSGFRLELPMDPSFTWIAPIRTKPKRFYDGIKQNFSPDGEHTPMLLRQLLSNKSKAEGFLERLLKFGKASGLYEQVTAHSFNNSPQSPFELLIKFSGAQLNINNVGYGVSQVLPLIVEFLSGKGTVTFAVQQPEVHLHPKAQAALGDLLFEIAKEQNHKFFIETHSDYLIDRFRLALKKGKSDVESQIIFFHRIPKGNQATTISISSEGKYPKIQPREFKEFFIKEEIRMLEL